VDDRRHIRAAVSEIAVVIEIFKRAGEFLTFLGRQPIPEAGDTPASFDSVIVIRIIDGGLENQEKPIDRVG
jgi:hypothetical protein